MQKYEILYIIQPNLSEDAYKKAEENVLEWITKTSGTILYKNTIGMKDLAYEIKKNVKGYYVLIQFECEKKTLDELEKRLRLDTIFLRHLTVKLESVKPVIRQKEEIKEEIKEEKKEEVKEEVKEEIKKEVKEPEVATSEKE